MPYGFRAIFELDTESDAEAGPNSGGAVGWLSSWELIIVVYLYVIDFNRLHRVVCKCTVHGSSVLVRKAATPARAQGHSRRRLTLETIHERLL